LAPNEIECFSHREFNFFIKKKPRTHNSDDPHLSDGIAALLAALPHTPALTALDMRGRCIGDDGARALARALRPSLRRLAVTLFPTTPGAAAGARTGRSPRGRTIERTCHCEPSCGRCTARVAFANGDDVGGSIDFVFVLL
jgi:hypothetical protein